MSAVPVNHADKGKPNVLGIKADVETAERLESYVVILMGNGKNQRGAIASKRPSGFLNILLIWGNPSRQLASLEAKLEQYENAFKGLSGRYNLSAEQLMGISALDTAMEPVTQHSDSITADSPISFRLSGTSLSSVQSHQVPVHTAEDFNKDETAQATGFIGESSEVNWLHKLDKELGDTKDSRNPAACVPTQSLLDALHYPISESSYHLDDLDLPTIDESKIYDIPSKSTASYLYQTYLDWVHPSFPIIGTATFGLQFQTFFNNPALQPGNKWLAILNLIFAIGTQYYYLADVSNTFDTESYHSYFARARILSLEDRSFHHPDLQQLQVEGLAALYLLTSGQVNRAWKICGDAVRGAMSLGLHLYSMGPSTSDTSKEIRYRVWWSLYTMEHQLCVMTGRPSIISEALCTTPLPVPFDERDFSNAEVMSLIRRDALSSIQPVIISGVSRFGMNEASASSIPSTTCSSSTSGSLYFIQIVKLASTGKRMLSKLYTAEGMQQPRPSKEFTIRGLMIEIDAWCMNLPKEFDFTSTSSSTRSPSSLAGQRISLALLFYSTKIGITRPCLDISNPPQEDGSRKYDFCRKSATECVESACHMIRLFPEPPDVSALYKTTPWWCMLHFLMQATAVIYLELSYNTRHVPDKTLMVTKAAIKSFEWLSFMSKTSTAAEKARKLCERFLHRLGIHPNIQVSKFTGADGPSSQSSLTDEQPDEGVKLSQEIFTSPSSPILRSNSSAVRSSSIGLVTSDAQGSHNPYDEDYLPYDPSTGQITGSFFPGTGGNNDLGLGYYWNDRT
ncbi:hypothetical protein ARAM_005745 [Aspergillus rambellii]|uniref:Xylanolytic transcriptional activator regulatory domain-containing protein n=1 Tax=Aspergillus rambellii TaxID=308745 RepID=A0A0F8UW44_9EURO|nr:hypothetical protein ARAM_005745 [Aspergillus rambellii]